jgi:hypothetical protein
VTAANGFWWGVFDHRMQPVAVHETPDMALQYASQTPKKVGMFFYPVTARYVDVMRRTAGPHVFCFRRIDHRTSRRSGVPNGLGGLRYAVDLPDAKVKTP